MSVCEGSVATDGRFCVSEVGLAYGLWIGGAWEVAFLLVLLLGVSSFLVLSLAVEVVMSVFMLWVLTLAVDMSLFVLLVMSGADGDGVQGPVKGKPIGSSGIALGGMVMDGEVIRVVFWEVGDDTGFLCWWGVVCGGECKVSVTGW